MYTPATGLQLNNTVAGAGDVDVLPGPAGHRAQRAGAAARRRAAYLNYANSPADARHREREGNRKTTWLFYFKVIHV